MGTAALVVFEVEKGKRLLEILDERGLGPEVALWAYLPDYESWRLVISSSKFKGLEHFLLELRAGGMMPSMRPDVLYKDFTDPFIVDVRKRFAGQNAEYGYHFGGQYFGKTYIDDGYILRVC